MNVVCVAVRWATSQITRECTVQFSHLCAVCLLPCVVCTCDQECAYHGHSRCHARTLSLSSCIPHSIPHFPPSLLRALVVSRAFAPFSALSISLSHIHLRFVAFLLSRLAVFRVLALALSIILSPSLSPSLPLSNFLADTTTQVMICTCCHRRLSGKSAAPWAGSYGSNRRRLPFQK